MNIVVSEELQAYIDPLTPDEHAALERSILAEGCRDALVLWGDLLVDGHNRHGICVKHGLPFQTVQHPHFKSVEDVHLWMIDQHLGRRSVSDFQRGVLALRKREILAQRRAVQALDTQGAASTAASDAPTASAPLATADARADASNADTGTGSGTGSASATPLKTRADIARAARLSNSQVQLIEKIQNQAVPELVAAVKAGEISINAAATVAGLPAQDQKAAVLGGKDELRQVAKRVREVKRKPADGGAEPVAAAPWEGADGEASEVQALRQRVAELQADNEALRARVRALEAGQQPDLSWQRPGSPP
ncbi:MAG: plasmid replication/partition related protein [Proteobacteria bacterium]|uniref:plasmid replication/partition related protein n=1 Tax=Aquabacterium sp. TaxID=1872578 RepID=UPI0035C75A06|nr:plasmid replication/partition related protein [Pseudomonadota bacterium]